MQGQYASPYDVVLAPFCGCGCGTTVHAAQKLGRAWIGIDVTHLAIGLIEKRLRDAFEGVEFVTHSVPRDLEGARDLAARDQYHEFEKRALSLIAAQPGTCRRRGRTRASTGTRGSGRSTRGGRSFQSRRGTMWGCR